LWGFSVNKYSVTGHINANKHGQPVEPTGKRKKKRDTRYSLHSPLPGFLGDAAPRRFGSDFYFAYSTSTQILACTYTTIDEFMRLDALDRAMSVFTSSNAKINTVPNTVKKK
jgi:hypothetical protein